METVRELMGLALLGVQTVLLVPIIVRLVRTGTGAGMSLSAEAIWVAAGLGWLAYGALTGSPTLVVSGAIAALGSGVVGALVLRTASQTARRDAAVLGAVTGAGLLAGTLFGGVLGLSVGLSLFGIVQFVPQLVTSVHLLRTGGDTSGVSVLGSVLRGVYTGGWALWAGAWFLWGFQVAEIGWPLVTWGLVGLLAFWIQAAGALLGRSGAPQRVAAAH